MRVTPENLAVGRGMAPRDRQPEHLSALRAERFRDRVAAEDDDFGFASMRITPGRGPSMNNPARARPSGLAAGRKAAPGAAVAEMGP